MFVGRDEFLWAICSMCWIRFLVCAMSMDCFAGYLLIFVQQHYICMMCTPVYEYIYGCVKYLAGDGVTMFTLQLLAACLDQS